MSRCALAAFVAVALAASVLPAAALDVEWIHDTNWCNPSNWEGGSIPGGSDIVTFNEQYFKWNNNKGASILVQNCGGTPPVVKKLKLEGNLRLRLEGKMVFSDAAAAGTEKEFVARPEHMTRWSCPGNWKLLGQGDRVVHPERAPCGEDGGDEAVFVGSDMASLMVSVPGNTFLQSVTRDGVRVTSNAQVGALFESNEVDGGFPRFDLPNCGKTIDSAGSSSKCVKYCTAASDCPVIGPPPSQEEQVEELEEEKDILEEENKEITEALDRKTAPIELSGDLVFTFDGLPAGVLMQVFGDAASTLLAVEQDYVSDLAIPECVVSATNVTCPLTGTVKTSQATAQPPVDIPFLTAFYAPFLIFELEGARAQMNTDQISAFNEEPATLVTMAIDRTFPGATGLISNVNGVWVHDFAAIDGFSTELAAFLGSAYDPLSMFGVTFAVLDASSAIFTFSIVAPNGTLPADIVRSLQTFSYDGVPLIASGPITTPVPGLKSVIVPFTLDIDWTLGPDIMALLNAAVLAYLPTNNALLSQVDLKACAVRLASNGRRRDTQSLQAVIFAAEPSASAIDDDDLDGFTFGGQTASSDGMPVVTDGADEFHDAAADTLADAIAELAEQAGNGPGTFNGAGLTVNAIAVYPVNPLDFALVDGSERHGLLLAGQVRKLYLAHKDNLQGLYDTLARDLAQFLPVSSSQIVISQFAGSTLTDVSLTTTDPVFLESEPGKIEFGLVGVTAPYFLFPASGLPSGDAYITPPVGFAAADAQNMQSDTASLHKDMVKELLESAIFRVVKAAELDSINNQLFALTATTPAPSGGAASSSASIIPIIAAVAAVVLIVALVIVFLVMRKKSDGGHRNSNKTAADSDRHVVSFENPMYDDPSQAMALAQAPTYDTTDDNEGLYDEPAFAETTKVNPVYSAPDEEYMDNEEEDGGYLDVAPEP